ncbi:MAG: 23S rRNA (pseudouridine(1915)-N(3))-methyltransferase RlmH [Candidatus Woesearchaeota archaeon]|jgi:23S rRNA (pseudouridine1915-N3)-methyltransferase
MSKVIIIAVGKLKDKSIILLLEEYVKRLGPYIKLEIKEIKDEGKLKESEKILNFIDENTFILDATGKNYTSEEFSEFLKKNQEKGDIKFIIGGPEGFTNEVRQKSKAISLSKMTFTHEMTRMLLLEQIYRAKMIEKGKPYHK